jgi:hypothetical protein
MRGDRKSDCGLFRTSASLKVDELRHRLVSRVVGRFELCCMAQGADKVIEFNINVLILTKHG